MFTIPRSPQPPRIDFTLSRSPLLSATVPNDLSSRGSTTPRLPLLVFAPGSPGRSTTLPARLQQLAKHQYQCIGLRMNSPATSPRNKPLPALPPPAIPPRQIISVLELLERMDNDVMKEVQRVKEGIAEAYVVVREFNQAKRAHENEWRKRREREGRETKNIDDEFWLNA